MEGKVKKKVCLGETRAVEKAKTQSRAAQCFIQCL